MISFSKRVAGRSNKRRGELLMKASLITLVLIVLTACAGQLPPSESVTVPVTATVLER